MKITKILSFRILLHGFDIVHVMINPRLAYTIYKCIIYNVSAVAYNRFSTIATYLVTKTNIYQNLG